jgi:hypothetical protein
VGFLEDTIMITNYIQDLADAQGQALREDRLRSIVKAAGALWVGIQEGATVGRDSVLFQAEPRGSTIAVYETACSFVNVQLALKAQVEKAQMVKTAHML